MGEARGVHVLSANAHEKRVGRLGRRLEATGSVGHNGGHRVLYVVQPNFGSLKVLKPRLLEKGKVPSVVGVLELVRVAPPKLNFAHSPENLSSLFLHQRGE